MPPETERLELEMRIAFLEDQIDGLNQALVSEAQRTERLETELKALVKLVRPILADYADRGADDNTPPPHY